MNYNVKKEDQNLNDFNTVSIKTAEPPIINGVDINQGVARFGGKRDKYLAALRKFTASMPTLLPDDMYENGLLRNGMAENIHTIKGVAGNLGMTEFSALIKDFEETLRRNDLDDKLYEKLVSMRKELTADILAATEGVPTDTKNLERGGYLEYTQLLEQLKKYLETSDITMCEQILNKLQSKSWGRSRDALVTQVAVKIQDYELDEAADLIGNQ